MKLFFEKYTETIYKGLKEILVTDKQEKQLSVQEGLECWSKRAKLTRDEYKGLTFFCGNGASATMAEHMSHDWFQS